ncbi:hypothetical protein REPUB_Repub18cG0146000 [Reevesia pubescens]
MDSLSLSGICSGHHVSPSSTMVDFDQSNHSKDGFFFGNNASFARKQDSRRQGLTITRVASPLRPVIVPSKENEIVDHPDRNHVAWTSVRQERWEGELDEER